MRRPAALGRQTAVGTADAYFIVSVVNQNVALLVNRNSTGCECNVQENPWVKSRLSVGKSKAPWHSSAIKI